MKARNAWKGARQYEGVVSQEAQIPLMEMNLHTSLSAMDSAQGWDVNGYAFALYL